MYVSHRVLATLAVQNGVFVKRIQKSSKKSLFQKSVVSPQNTALFNPLSTTAFQQNHIMLEETTNSTKNVVVNAYEAARDLRVRQNIERMKSIGIEAAKTKVDAIVAISCEEDKERLVVGVAFIQEESQKTLGNLAVQTTDVVARAR